MDGSAVRHLTYLAVLAGCLASALWLEPVLRVGRAAPVATARCSPWSPVVVLVFVAWDLVAIAAGHWSYDPGQLVGVTLPGRLPLEELLFFLVVPLCAILGFEAVRTVTGWPRTTSGPSDRRPSCTPADDDLHGRRGARGGRRARARPGGAADPAGARPGLLAQLPDRARLPAGRSTACSTGRGVVRYDPAAILGPRWSARRSRTWRSASRSSWPRSRSGSGRSAAASSLPDRRGWCRSVRSVSRCGGSRPGPGRSASARRRRRG